MVARSIPAQPTFSTRSHHDVWRRLVDQLRPQDVVLADLRLIGAQQDHRIDFLVLMPDVGIMVVEVQGGRIFTKGIDWYQLGTGGDRRITPIGHVLGNMFAIRRHIADDPRWTGQRVRLQHCLIAPDTDFSASFAMPDCSRAQVHGAEDQPHLATRMREILRHDHQGGRPPRADEIELLVEMLTGPTLGGVGSAAPVPATTRVSTQQHEVLKVLRQHHRVEVRGSTGSGKSRLALLQARELTRGLASASRLRVALVCYSKGHGAQLQRAADLLDARERPAFVGTFEEFGRSIGAPDGDRTDSSYWERQFPAHVADRVARLAADDRYDAVIVDEGQDFADAWWTPLIQALRDDEHGRFYVYRDANRHLFRQFAAPPVTLLSLGLDDNHATTHQIAAAYAPLAPTASLAQRQGQAVTYRAVDPDDVLAAASAEVHRLLESGQVPGDILVLSTGSRHPHQLERQQRRGLAGYWESFWDDDVFYGHVLGCKGLRRPAVVLCLNDHEPRDRLTERLYIGMSRATASLTVVGEPARLTELGLVFE